MDSTIKREDYINYGGANLSLSVCVVNDQTTILARRTIGRLTNLVIKLEREKYKASEHNTGQWFLDLCMTLLHYKYVLNLFIGEWGIGMYYILCSM